MVFSFMTFLNLLKLVTLSGKDFLGTNLKIPGEIIY